MPISTNIQILSSLSVAMWRRLRGSLGAWIAGHTRTCGLLFFRLHSSGVFALLTARCGGEMRKGAHHCLRSDTTTAGATFGILGQDRRGLL
jgi:hypothetical protein